MMMEHEQVEYEVARKSVWIYLPISLGAALVFLLAARFGEYPPVAVYGGATWVGLLTLIITMPVVTSWVKKQTKRR
jgi:NADH:ubiquinone oxidoreductase subunit 6 (subunit J)